MFDIGFLELLMIAVIGLLVMGPERLPGAIRTGSLWLGRLRRSFNQIKSDIEREVGADEIRQQLHNESVLKSLEEAEKNIHAGINSIQPDLNALETELNEPTLSKTVSDDTTNSPSANKPRSDS